MYICLILLVNYQDAVVPPSLHQTNDAVLSINMNWECT